MTTRFRSATACSLVVLAFSLFAHADGPRVLPEGKQPNDIRLQPLKDLDGYFPFTPPVSKEAWAKRAGVFPKPKKNR